MVKRYKTREIYMDKIRPFIDKDIIKVIIGQRRVGKSHLLFQIMNELKTKYKVLDEQIIYINKELNEFEDISNYQDLLNFIKNNKTDNKTDNKTKTNNTSKTYVIIDEIQDIEYFEKALRDLQALGNYDIYISGSNAHLLSSEIATYLTGRYIEFEVYPLNYKEFLDFHSLDKNKESFMKYIKFGGMPYLIHLELDEDVVFDYINSIYNSILLKDIVSRYNIRNIDFLDRLLSYLADNIGQLVTAKNISDYLKSQKINISVNIVLDYINFSSSVFLVNKVKRQDIVGKKIFEVNDKFFFSDIGIRNNIVGAYKQTDIAKILENIVFLHFKSLGYAVTVGKYKNKEIDFVVQKGSDIKYIQVSYLINNDETKEREFGNLLKINDNYEKIVLSMDELISGDYKGVKHYNIIDFLAM